jgi:hypothetical protein
MIDWQMLEESGAITWTKMWRTRQEVLGPGMNGMLSAPSGPNQERVKLAGVLYMKWHQKKKKMQTSNWALSHPGSNDIVWASPASPPALITDLPWGGRLGPGGPHYRLLCWRAQTPMTKPNDQISSLAEKPRTSVLSLLLDCCLAGKGLRSRQGPKGKTEVQKWSPDLWHIPTQVS